MAILNVVANKLPESDAFPKGVQKLMIESASDIKTDKKGTPFINLLLKVVDGEYQGRAVFHNYVTVNGAKLRNLLEGAKLEKVNDTMDLVGVMVDAYVDIDKDEEFGDKNVVKHYIIKK